MLRACPICGAALVVAFGAVSGCEHYASKPSTCAHYDPERYKMGCAISRGFAPRDCGHCKFHSEFDPPDDAVID